jgi:(S)-sulfolactate dehydrogenase
MSRIIISEFMDERAVATLESGHDVVYDPRLADSPDELLSLMPGADALIVRNRTRVDEGVLDAGRQLRVVGRLGVGLDNIDVDACALRNVEVRPATGANADSVAEYVIAATLMLIRGVFLSTSLVGAGEWPRVSMTGLEVRGRTMGLVGLGDIAQRVAKLARSMGMHVIAYDPFLAQDHPAWALVARGRLDEVLAAGDALSIHVPLTPDTRGMLDAVAIEQMKRTAVVINTSRGGIVDENALVDALQSGTLRGAALDVFAVEPVNAESGSRFEGVPNLVLTPHIAGITEESNERVSMMVAAEVMDVLEGRRE